MDESEREKVLDVFCAHYYDLKIICSDYDIYLPESEDLGYIRNFLNDNLDEILICISHCYCGGIVNEINKLIRKDDRYGKNKRRYDKRSH